MYALKSGLTSVFAIILFAHVSFAWVRFREPLSRRNFLNQTLIEKLQNCAGKEEQGCGLCGEGPGEVATHGIPTENYTVVDPDVRVLAVELGFRSGLNGFLEFRVCNVTDNSTTDAIKCNAITPLLIGSDEQWYPAVNQTSAKSRFRLPRGLLCERCVLQVKYTPGPNSTMKDFRFYDCALLNITYPTKVITNTILTTRTVHYNKEFPHDPQITEIRQGSAELRSANTHQINNLNILRSVNRTVNVDVIRQGNTRLNADAVDRRSGVHTMDSSVNVDINRQGDSQMNSDQDAMLSVNTAVVIDSNQGNNQVNINSNNQGVTRSVNRTVNLVHSINTDRDINQNQQGTNVFNSRSVLITSNNTLRQNPSGEETDSFFVNTAETKVGQGDNLINQAGETVNNDKTVVISTKFYNFSQNDDNVASAPSENVARITTIDIKGNAKSATGSDESIINNLRQTDIVETSRTEGAGNTLFNLNNDDVITNTAIATSTFVSDVTGQIEKHSFNIYGVNLDKKVKNNLSETSSVVNNINADATNSNLINDAPATDVVIRAETRNVQNSNSLVAGLSNNIGTVQGETTANNQEAITNNESLGYYDYAYYYYNDTASGNDTYIYYEDTVNTYNESQADVTASLIDAQVVMDSSNGTSMNGESEIRSMADINSASSQLSNKELSTGSNVSVDVSNVDITNSLHDFSTISDQVYHKKQKLDNTMITNELINKANIDVTENITNFTNLDIKDVSNVQGSKAAEFVNRETVRNVTYTGRKTSNFTNELLTSNAKSQSSEILIPTHSSSSQVDSNSATFVDVIKETNAQNINQRIVVVPNTIVVLPERNNTNTVKKYIVEGRSNQTSKTIDTQNTAPNHSEQSGQSRSIIEVTEKTQSHMSAKTAVINDSHINVIEKSVGWNDSIIDENQLMNQANLFEGETIDNAASVNKDIVKPIANDVPASTTIIYPYDASTDTSFNEARKKLVYATSAADRKPIYAHVEEIKHSQLHGDNIGSGSSKDSSALSTNINTQIQKSSSGRIRIIDNTSDLLSSSGKSNAFTSTRYNVTTGVRNDDLANSVYDVTGLGDRLNDKNREKINFGKIISNEHNYSTNDKKNGSNNELVYSANLTNHSIGVSENTNRMLIDMSAKYRTGDASSINGILASNSRIETFDSSSKPRHVIRGSVERSAFPGRVFAVVPDLTATRALAIEEAVTSKQNELSQNEITKQNNKLKAITHTFSGISDLLNESYSILNKTSTSITETSINSSTNTINIDNSIMTTSNPNIQLDISTRPYDNYLGILSTTEHPFEKAGSTFVRMVNYSEITSDSIFPAPKLDVSSVSDIIGNKQTNTESVLMSIFTSTPLPIVTNDKSTIVSTDASNTINSQSGFDNKFSFSNLNFFADSGTQVDRLGGVPVLSSQDENSLSKQAHLDSTSSSTSNHLVIRNETSRRGYFDMTNMLNSVYNKQTDQHSTDISNSKIFGLAVPFGNSQLDSDSKLSDTNSKIDSIMSDSFTSTNNDKPSHKTGYLGGKSIVWQSMQLSNISSLPNKIGSNNVLLQHTSINISNNKDNSTGRMNASGIDLISISNDTKDERRDSSTFITNDVVSSVTNASGNGRTVFSGTVANIMLNDKNVQASNNGHVFIKNISDSGTFPVFSLENGKTKVLNRGTSFKPLDAVIRTTTSSDAMISDNNINTRTSSVPNDEVMSTFTESVPRMLSTTTEKEGATLPLDTTVRSTQVQNVNGIGRSVYDRAVETVNADTKIIPRKTGNVLKDSDKAPSSSFEMFVNVNSEMNNIGNTDSERVTIVNDGVPFVNNVLKSTNVEDLDITINGNANKNNILAARNIKRQPFDSTKNVPIIMPPIEVKKSTRGVINRISYLTDQDQNQKKLLIGQILLTPKRNITLFNPFLKATDYNIKLPKIPLGEVRKEANNTVFRRLSGTTGKETSKSNLSLSTIWDINRGNTDVQEVTVENRATLPLTIQTNNINSDKLFRVNNQNSPNRQQVFNNLYIVDGRNETQHGSSKNKTDINQQVLRTLEALFLELGAIDAKNDQTKTQTSPVYRDISNEYRGSYPLFRVHENLLTLPTVVREFGSNQQYMSSQRGSDNHRLLNNVAVANQRDWNNTFKLSTNINVENISDLRNSGQSVIDMSRMPTGNSNLFSRLSNTFADVSRQGRGNEHTKNVVQNSKETTVIQSQNDSVSNGMINETDIAQDLPSNQIVQSTVRKQAIIKSLGSGFFNPFTGENITLPVKGKHFSDTFIARGIGNLQQMKGVEQLLPAKFFTNATNEKYTYILNNKSKESKNEGEQTRLSIVRQPEPDTLATNKVEALTTNKTSVNKRNVTETGNSNVDDGNMIVKASILSRLFSKSDSEINTSTRGIVELPSPDTSQISDFGKTNILETMKSSPTDSSQISDGSIVTGYPGSVTLPLFEESIANNEQLTDSSRTFSMPSVTSSNTNSAHLSQLTEINQLPSIYELDTYTIDLFDVNKMKQNSKSRGNNGKLFEYNNILQTQNVLTPDNYFFTQNELLKGIALNPAEMSSLSVDSSLNVASNGRKEVFEDKGGKCKDNEMFICDAEGKNRDIPGMVWWCFSHCKNGLCPPEKCTCRCEKLTTLLRNETTARQKVSGAKRRKKVIQLTLNNPAAAGDNIPNESTIAKGLTTSIPVIRNAESSRDIIQTNNTVVSVMKSGNMNIVNSESNSLNVPLQCKGINAFADTTGIDALCTKMCAQNICPDAICRCL